jgi:hypothetical protein
MSYRLQVQTLFQLHIDPGFRTAFRADPVASVPELSGPERDELLKLPIVGPRSQHEETHSACAACSLVPVAAGQEESASAGSAFLRIGVRRRCAMAMPRTYAEVERAARQRGKSLETDFLLTVDFWRPVPQGQHRDEISANAAVHWTETAKVLHVSNRIYWQFYGYAVSVAAREGAAVPYLADLARFEYETLSRRISLYRKFQSPGPARATLAPAARPRLTRYAECARYEHRVAETPPQARPCGVVFLYNGERLRMLQLEPDAASVLSWLDGSVAVEDFEPRARRVLEAMASVGVVEAAA